MKWAAARQSLIAGNIAHANTPGFQPKDLKPLDFRSVLKATQSPSLAVTNPKHISPVRAEGPFEKHRLSYETSLSHNGVDVEEQALLSAKTKDMHTEAANIYSKYSGMFRLVIGRGGGL
ncbi:MAG: flagellar basal body rod protein FlgB [Alphaproteobacteria bacterium]|nr:MAG: flagellar basal body rod protein FlgB [Alphaproteobacteria bacterium]